MPFDAFTPPFFDILIFFTCIISQFIASRLLLAHTIHNDWNAW